MLSIIEVALEAPSLQPPPANCPKRSQELFVEDADKALCEAIGSTNEREKDTSERRFQAVGPRIRLSVKRLSRQFKSETLGLGANECKKLSTSTRILRDT